MFFVVFRVVKFAIFYLTKLRVFVCKRAGAAKVFISQEKSFFCLCAEVYMLYNFLGVNCALLAKEVTLGVLS